MAAPNAVLEALWGHVWSGRKEQQDWVVMNATGAGVGGGSGTSTGSGLRGLGMILLPPSRGAREGLKRLGHLHFSEVQRSVKF